MLLQKGTLRQRIIETTEKALLSGALLPIPTSCAYIKDDGNIRFLVRVLENLKRKDEARKAQVSSSREEKKVNPFLPPEKELTVADITETHRAILNKFNVMEYHLLIVTRMFEDQDTLLTVDDFEALWLCLREYDGLGFYNGGREAGASQQHKHLQFVPLPLAPDYSGSPIDLVLPRNVECSACSIVPAFPFLHSFVRLKSGLVEDPIHAAHVTFQLYSDMLHSVRMQRPDVMKPVRQSMPYCFLVTREWMLLVPRTTEFYEGISFNALAFAGSLFVRNEQQLTALRTCGPINALMAVTAPS